MEYREALNKITDWFSSYKDERGVIVHERHITEEYKEAKETMNKLIDKIENGTLIEFPRIRERKRFRYPYKVEFVDEDGDVNCEIYKTKEQAEEKWKELKGKE